MVRLREVREAWYAFGRMEEMHVFYWNGLLGGYAKIGLFDECLALHV